MLDPRWEGKTAVLIASGPSLTEEQCRHVAERHTDDLVVVGCNDAYRMYPALDLLYAADKNWWKHHLNSVRPLGIPELCMPDKAYAEQNGLTFILGKGGGELSTKRTHIHYASNSGFQIFNICFLRGVSKMILLGFDYTKHGGKAHWFGSHGEGMRDPPDDMGNWSKAYATSLPALEKAGVEVINCSPISLIQCFPKIDIAEAIIGIK